MSSEIAISVQNLSKCYQIYDRPRDRLFQMFSRGRKQYFREFWALKDVSFEIKRGETLGIIGRNGSGKSTLLQLLCGTLSPTSGTITIKGKVAALLELGAGFNPEFTGRENVFLSASLYGMTNEQTAERFDQILSFADIGQFIDQPVKTYSSGMFVRLAFAVIAHVDADILVVDEALAVGDAYFVQKCMRFLRGFTERGTLIFVSHDSTAVVGLCSSALLLDKGILQFGGTPKEATDFYLASLNENLAIADSSIERQPECNYVADALKEFGSGAVRIVSVRLSNADGSSISSISGGEKIRLTIECLSTLDVINPIVGFLVRDRLGQVVFGMNSIYAKKGRLDRIIKDRPVEVTLSFHMPTLQAGDYSLGVAVAEGTQTNHIQHHWIHDALILPFRPSRTVSGIIGIELDSVEVC
ncbi:MAG: Teichoic acids export ATP-binding protein TagH [Dehalococcoidia bacterium]|nr:Teichoic acids export ATP-binding protein TagH [Chloroflexota bacterium]MBT9161784.1 Teichoic acids export ATP-binding protein TagH [Chloroflexota bacterium]